MNVSSTAKLSFLHPKKILKIVLLTIVCFCFLPFFVSCNKEVRYFDYVSELRNNIFLAETDGFSLRVYSVTKESPYSADGVPRETNVRTEIWLVAPSGDKECNVSFSVDAQSYGGEMSFDNVKTEYYYACPLDISALKELVCHIEYGETTLDLTASSVVDESTLSPETVLQNLVTVETELFQGLTDKYGFAGEIYVRLIYEDSPYYYVGVIDRNGQTNAFLINAKSGKILAKRQS
ncbi:MAG: hypothetical protein IJX96_05850 [Clostridia bacterium]|nr:hypothetical protein [Clostridia bacterium]